MVLTYVVVCDCRPCSFRSPDCQFAYIQSKSKFKDDSGAVVDVGSIAWHTEEVRWSDWGEGGLGQKEKSQ